MSHPHLSCFLNDKRPRLKNPLVKTLPTDVLGPDLSTQVLASQTQVDDSNGSACAALGRLWEDVLEMYRVPYLMLRVADMRMALGSEVTALSLYQELNDVLKNKKFEKWIERTRKSCMDETEELLSLYRSSSVIFTPGQRWKPRVANDTFPSPGWKLPQEDVDALNYRWNSIKSSKIERRYMNMCSLNTNDVEGVFQFDQKTYENLLSRDFDEPHHAEELTKPIAGAVRNLDDALDNLRDTSKATSEIYTFLDPENPRKLTVSLIRTMHATLMKTCRITFDETNPDHGHLSYKNIGVTRQTCMVNVTVASEQDGRIIRVQFCPYDQVDEELEGFCVRFNEIIRKPDIDPLACAAWISHVFITIHPFEDGNGRLSRILASIPMVRKGLPPLCLSASLKKNYFASLNEVRSRGTDFHAYSRLMKELANGVERALYFVAKSVSQ